MLGQQHGGVEMLREKTCPLGVLVVLIVANPTEDESRPDRLEALQQADRMIGKVTMIIFDCHPRILNTRRHDPGIVLHSAAR
jgi:hypothetical protein